MGPFKLEEEMYVDEGEIREQRERELKRGFWRTTGDTKSGGSYREFQYPPEFWRETEGTLHWDC